MPKEIKECLEYKDGELFWKITSRGAKAGDRYGTLMTNEYRYGSWNRKPVSEHRLIWEMFNGPIPLGLTIDHINRDRLDNRIENLRLASNSQNRVNRPNYENSKHSRFKGVGFHKQSGNYRTRIRTPNGKDLTAYSKCELDAATIYNFWVYHYWPTHGYYNSAECELAWRVSKSEDIRIT